MAENMNAADGCFPSAARFGPAQDFDDHNTRDQSQKFPSSGSVVVLRDYSSAFYSGNAIDASERVSWMSLRGLRKALRRGRGPRPTIAVLDGEEFEDAYGDRGGDDVLLSDRQLIQAVRDDLLLLDAPESLLRRRSITIADLDAELDRIDRGESSVEIIAVSDRIVRDELDDDNATAAMPSPEQLGEPLLTMLKGLREMPVPEPKMVEHALSYAALGWHVVPIWPMVDGKCRCPKRATCDAPGKHPIPPRGQNDATRDPEKIRRFWEILPEASIGASLRPSGLMAFDLDNYKGDDKKLASLANDLGPLPDSALQKSGSGDGFHAIYRLPPNAALRGELGGITIRGNNYIVLAPSNHRSGKRYEWIVPPTSTIAELPAAWVDALRRTVDVDVDAPTGIPLESAEPAWLRAIPQDERVRRMREHLAREKGEIKGTSRPGMMFDVARTAARGYAVRDPKRVLDAMLEVFNPKCQPPYAPERIADRVDGAYRDAVEPEWGYKLADGPQQAVLDGFGWVDQRGVTAIAATTTGALDMPKLIEHTELANGRRIATKFGDRLRYVGAWKSWLEWDGRRWHRDELGAEMTAAKSVAEDYFLEAAKMLASAGRDKAKLEEVDRILHWAKRSSTRSCLVASAALAQSEPPISAHASDYDQDPWLLNVNNGTIDLRTGGLRKHRQADRLTLLAPIRFSPDATCPQWDAFVAWALPDADVRAWVQRFLGYALTGQVGEQIVVFLHGGGANGKSTLLDVIQHVLGEYQVQGSPALIMSAEHGGTGEELARRQRATLKGRRFVVVQELEAGRFMGEAQIKTLTGGDKFTAARLYENETEIMPTHKLVVATNHKPQVRGSDNAIWRRIRLVPFVQTVAEGDRDPDLARKLRSEAPGILAWLVRGCLAWQREGLVQPTAMRSAVAAYRTKEDRLAEFLDDTTEPGDGAPTDALYRAYESWCEARGEKRWTRRALVNALEERGHEATRAVIDGKRCRAVAGLKLRADAAIF